MSDSRRSRARLVIISLLVVGLIVGGGGLAMAAAPSTDTTNDGDSSSVSDVNDGDTIEYNSSNTTYQWNADSNNTKLDVDMEDSDWDVYDDGDPVKVTWNNTDNDGEFNSTFDNDALGDQIEAGANENATLNWTVINDTSVSNPDETHLTLYYQNGEVRAVENIGDGEDQGSFDEAGTIGNTLAAIPFSPFSDVGTATAEADSITVDGENTSLVRLNIGNGSEQDAYGEAAAVGDGHFVPKGYAVLDGEVVPMVVNDTDDVDWIDEDEHTYASVNTDGDTVVFHNVNESISDDDTNVDVEVRGNSRALSIGDLNDWRSEYDLGIIEMARLVPSVVG